VPVFNGGAKLSVQPVFQINFYIRRLVFPEQFCHRVKCITGILLLALYIWQTVPDLTRSVLIIVQHAAVFFSK